MHPDPSSRPPLDRERLIDTFAGTRWRPEVLAETTSTNLVAVDRARAGAAEGLVVVTDHQTAGRGRLDRAWVTPRGVALTFSVILTPDDVPVVRWPWLPLLTGVAVAEAVRRVAGVDAALKWPNDVLLGEGSSRRKVCGILVERVEPADGRGGAAAVVGIGVNVLQTADELPVDSATSLLLAGGGAPDRTVLLSAVLDELASRYDTWREAGGDPLSSRLLAGYSELCATIGQDVRVQLPHERDLAGRALAVDEDGRLRVQTSEGVVAVGAGDVVHVRPAGQDPRTA